jgi:hypothetical protein
LLKRHELPCAWQHSSTIFVIYLFGLGGYLFKNCDIKASELRRLIKPETHKFFFY